MTVTGKALGGYTKYLQEAIYEYGTNVDEVVGKVINNMKSYNIDFHIGNII